VPRLTDIQIHSETDSKSDVSLFIKRLSILLRKDRLSDGEYRVDRCITGSVNLSTVIPTLFDDIQNRMDAWGKQGTIDPFKNIYDVRQSFSI
jgi:sterol 14-demethylase